MSDPSRNPRDSPTKVLKPKSAVNKLASDISKRMQLQYTLLLYSNSNTGSYRQIEVKIIVGLIKRKM